jgi:tRNA 2-selenouridine synthase
MADVALDIVEFLNRAQTLPVIDVRSPAEYDHAHIPGAVNLPLFSNEERSIIGTLYLKKGSAEAMMKGLEIIGPRMKDFAAAGYSIAPGGETLMHCWRGGMRSNSMAWLLNTVGIKTHTLTGGYKSYRHYALDYFKKPLHLVVIGGMTGSGKTDVLEALERSGQQILHLERLASHKGSVFGAIGMPKQPSTEQFENDLFRQLTPLDPNQPVFVEDESLAIGNVFIPRIFYEQMSSSRFINLSVTVERRVKHLVNDYTGGDTGLLIAGVKRIERRLGLENAAKIIEHIQKSEMDEAVMRLLKYYDKVYVRSMSMHRRQEITEIWVGEKSAGEIAEEIVRILKPVTGNR